MNKSKIYHLLLGIGLGIIITSSLNIVFNKTEKIEYTDEQVIERAKTLGMISIKENIENNDKEKKKEKDKKEKEKPSEEVSKVDDNPEVETTKESDETIESQTKPDSNQQKAEAQAGHKLIVIDTKDTASSIIKKLKTNGIIENEKELKELVVSHNLQRKFRSGTYEIKENSTYEEVLKKLIKENELKNAGFL